MYTWKWGIKGKLDRVEEGVSWEIEEAFEINYAIMRLCTSLAAVESGPDNIESWIINTVDKFDEFPMVNKTGKTDKRDVHLER